MIFLIIVLVELCGVEVVVGGFGVFELFFKKDLMWLGCECCKDFIGIGDEMVEFEGEKGFVFCVVVFMFW